MPGRPVTRVRVDEILNQGRGWGDKGKGNSEAIFSEKTHIRKEEELFFLKKHPPESKCNMALLMIRIN